MSAPSLLRFRREECRRRSVLITKHPSAVLLPNAGFYLSQKNHWWMYFPFIVTKVIRSLTKSWTTFSRLQMPHRRLHTVCWWLPSMPSLKHWSPRAVAWLLFKVIRAMEKEALSSVKDWRYMEPLKKSTCIADRFGLDIAIIVPAPMISLIKSRLLVLTPLLALIWLRWGYPKLSSPWTSSNRLSAILEGQFIINLLFLGLTGSTHSPKCMPTFKWLCWIQPTALSVVVSVFLKVFIISFIHSFLSLTLENSLSHSLFKTHSL